ncbi:poly(ethylene terephthalate) hydrolase family protein [Steroidobacter agaridevorans]|nr:hypothetical protein [Steroidobacter agaridevorans]
MRLLTFATIAIGALVSAGASAATIFQENFAGGLGTFTSSGSVATGSYGARMRGGLSGGAQITSAAISTAGFTNVQLSFDRTTSGLDLGEAAVASFSTDGSTFTQLESVRTASGRVTLSLGAGANNQSRVFLRFAVNASSLLETYTVANIVLDGTGGSDPDPGGGVLPPVSSIETDGPFSTTIDMNAGSGRSGWVVRPTTLGQNGLRHPVFVWGPGAGATPSSYEFHLRRLASHGFVVYSEVSTSSGSEIRAALDWLVSENGRAGSPYYQRLALDRMAAGGHSRGSIGTFAIASDSRLKTTIHVAGGSFDGNGSRNLRNPAIYICGENDTTATPNCERDYSATTVPIVFTIMDNVDHINAARSGLPAITAWLRWQIGGETDRRGMFIGAGCYFCGGIWSTRSKNW